MTNDSSSFWIIPDVTKMSTPLSILREQAESLTERTNGLLKGLVTTASDVSDEKKLSIDVDYSCSSSA
jgi:hypothetical protein